MTNGHRATLVSLSFSLPQLSSAQTPKTPSPKHTRLKRQSMTSLQAEEPEQALVSSLANASLIESAEFTFATADGDRLTVNRSTLALHAPIIRSMFEDAHDTGDIITLQGTTRAWRAVLDIINTPFDMPLPSTGVLQEALLIVSTFEMVLVKSHILLLTLQHFAVAPNFVLQVLAVEDPSLHLHYQRLYDWERAVTGNPTITMTGPIVQDLLVSYDARHEEREYERRINIFNEVTSIFCDQRVHRCKLKKHGWGQSGKMAHNQWADATTWWRNQIVVHARKNIRVRDALKTCRERYEDVEGCDTCTSRVTDAFIEVFKDAQRAGLV